MSELELEKKAENGDREAQCSLAMLYEIGMDRPQDFIRAAQYWKMAAHGGSTLAYEKLQHLIETGKIPADFMRDVKAPDGRNLTPGPSPIRSKILMLEDEDDLREMLSETLQAAGYKVLTAANGEEGLALLIAHADIALILTDLKMPRMNGLQFMASLKKLDLAYAPPMVVMTAYSQQRVIDEGLKLGISAWIVKPVKKDMLLETLHRLLKKKG